MADVNKVILIGRLTRDPQLKHLPNQTAICEFGMAMGRKYKAASGEQREETTFVDGVLFGKGAEIFAQYMTKGKKVYIEGRLKYDTWEDKNGGGKRSKLSVNVDEFQFLDSPGGREGGEAGGEASGAPPASAGRRPAASRQGQPFKKPAKSGPPAAPYGDEQAFNDDDIPF